MTSLPRSGLESFRLTPREREILALAVADCVRPVKGGRRPGAGRKPVTPMTLASAAAILEDLAAVVLRGEVARSDLARRIFRDAMRARRRVLKGTDHA